MASDWIKMRVDLREQVEVIQMSAILKMDVLSIIGRLHALWSWVDKNSLDGQKMPITFAWIDDYCLTKNFANSLQKVGWLRGKDGQISFPNFDRHNGKTAKTRAETNLRVAKSRATKPLQNGNDDVTQKALQKPLPEKNKKKIYKKETTSPKKGDFPTLSECEDFAKSEFGLNGTFASRFFTKHSANGWCLKTGELIHDWQALMRGLANSMSVIERDQVKAGSSTQGPTGFTPGSILNPPFTMPWGTQSPDDLPPVKLLKINEAEGEADFEEIDSRQKWCCFGSQFKPVSKAKPEGESNP